jgi:hypothetical protein
MTKPQVTQSEDWLTQLLLTRLRGVSKCEQRIGTKLQV